MGSLTIALGLLLLFVFVEKTVRTPMVPLKLFQSARFRGANLLTLFLYAAMGIFFFLFPLNLIQIQKYSATATGAASLPMILLMFLLSRPAGGTHRPLWCKDSACGWSAHCGRRLSSVWGVWRTSSLLVRLFSSIRCSWTRHGHQCRAFDNGGNELRRAGARRYSIGNQ